MGEAVAAKSGMVDSHCHLDAADFVGDVREVLQRGRDAGVAWFVAIGSGRGTESAPDAIALARTNRDVVACVGIHPLDAPCATPNTLGVLENLADDWHVVGIGETGLDYRLAYAQKDAQKSAFREQIRLAKKVKKPLVLHSRAAAADTLAILREENAREVGGVVHSFTDDQATAFALLDLNFDLSFSALVLLHEVPAIRSALQAIPLDRIVIESNAPVLAPPEHRGGRCEPAHLGLIADGLARLLSIDPAELRATTARTALRRFGLAEGGRE